MYHLASSNMDRLQKRHVKGIELPKKQCFLCISLISENLDTCHKFVLFIEVVNLYVTSAAVFASLVTSSLLKLTDLSQMCH